MYVVAIALLGLIALMATLQYKWLGQISAAERERMKANLASRTTAFAQDFDREITRAYLTFQVDAVQGSQNLPARLAERHDRWIATSRYPRLVKDVYTVTREDAGAPVLQRYNAATKFLEPVEWPAAMQPIRDQLSKPDLPPSGATVFVRTLPSLWDTVPAVVVPMPIVLVNDGDLLARRTAPSADLRMLPTMRYTVLGIDREYVANEMLPALAQQHFRGGTEGTDFQMAVVSATDKSTVYNSGPLFTGQENAAADATADLFQVRMQEFGAMAAEVRRFTSFIAQTQSTGSSRTQVQQLALPSERVNSFTIRENAPLSIMLQHEGPAGGAARRSIETALASTTVRSASNTARWKLVVKHPSGSLETAVAQARRRNLLVSSGILAILGVSVGFLVVTTRRAQDLARQQMEFVAAVSHELRTPLAVIRSAAENLADGVVHEEAQVRQYGELMRGEGRRLSEMVEQILELAGIQSGQRGFALRPVAVLPLLHDVARASAKLADDAGIAVEMDIPDGLPPVLGDEQALRRVFQNLFGNAIKYGAGGGWIGITARATGRDVQVTIADKGIGIAPADQEHIFEPFYRAPGVIEAQIQGAGLGLSLVQRIVEAHGGRIAVRSAPGEGSEFTVHLPSASEEAVTRTSGAADPAHRLS